MFDHPKVALGTQTIVKIPLYLLVAWKDARRRYKGILEVSDINLFDPAHDQTKVARVGQGRILGVTVRKGVRFQFLDADYIGDVLANNVTSKSLSTGIHVTLRSLRPRPVWVTRVFGRVLGAQDSGRPKGYNLTLDKRGHFNFGLTSTWLAVDITSEEINTHPM